MNQNLCEQESVRALPEIPTSTMIRRFTARRVLTATGRGQTRTAYTTTFGYFRFTNVPLGETYVLNARAKRFEFVQKSQVVSLSEDETDIQFIAVQQ